MMQNPPVQGVFHFDEHEPNFDSFSHENGFTHWYATELMEFLGYKSWDNFNKVISQAMQILNTLNIPIQEHIGYLGRVLNGKQITDVKLSRVACYYITMRADAKKPQVAQALQYFATLAGAVQDYVEQVEQAERVLVRSELTDHEKALDATAKIAGVERYDLFKNARYVGLYNMSINRLKQLRGIDSSRSPLDFMGKDELAANLFAISQTDLKIKSEKLRGQATLEKTAKEVAGRVRNTMMEISGVAPEALPVNEDIKTTKKNLKQSSKQLAKHDKKSKLLNKGKTSE